jgi:hypothetical protein
MWGQLGRATVQRTFHLVHRLGALWKYGSCFFGRHCAFRQSRKSDCVEMRGVALAGRAAGRMPARGRPRDSSLRRVRRDAAFWDVKEQGERPAGRSPRLLNICSISRGPDDFKRSSWASLALSLFSPRRPLSDFDSRLLEKVRDGFLHSGLITNPALPQNQDTPSSLSKQSPISTVTSDGTFEFRSPCGNIPPRHGTALAPSVPVPKATVDKDDFPRTGKHYIWAAG